MATKVGKHSITWQMMDQTFHRQTTIIRHHFNNAFSTETLFAHSQGKSNENQTCLLQTRQRGLDILPSFFNKRTPM